MANIGTYNLADHHKGDTWNGVQFTILSNGSAVDLTSATVRVMFRRESKTGKVVKSLTVGSGVTLTDASNGVLTIDAFTLDWSPNTYFYDVEVTLSGGTIRTYVEGYIKINQDSSY